VETFPRDLPRRDPGDGRPTKPGVLVTSPRTIGRPGWDIKSTHAELSARGDPLPPARQHFGWWALFEDNEGTRYTLGQWSDANTM
jgi:hypothetical protein